MEKTADFRKMPREPYTKHFAIHEDELAGYSNKQKFNKYPEFTDAQQLSNTCYIYAQAYTSTMMMRLEKEEPDFFEDKDYTRGEMSSKIIHNLCIDVNQYRTKKFQESITDMADKQHTTDDIRRLVNGGQKFHPYF